MAREVELPNGVTLSIQQDSELENDAGAVVWDSVRHPGPHSMHALRPAGWAWGLGVHCMRRHVPSRQADCGVFRHPILSMPRRPSC